MIFAFEGKIGSGKSYAMLQLSDAERVRIDREAALYVSDDVCEQVALFVLDSVRRTGG